MNLKDLAAPFPAMDVEWRVQSSGKKGDRLWAKVLAYITNRAIMNRLDEVCGPGGWSNEYKEGPGGGVLCGITVLIPGESNGNPALLELTKWDGAENTQIESVKGGLSDAMKRAAVQWGIGRYLYKLDAGWAEINDKGAFSAKTKEGQWFKWDPPKLPEWALPDFHARNEESNKVTAQPKDDIEPPDDHADEVFDAKALFQQIVDITNEWEPSKKGTFMNERVLDKIGNGIALQAILDEISGKTEQELF